MFYKILISNSIHVGGENIQMVVAGHFGLLIEFTFVSKLSFPLRGEVPVNLTAWFTSFINNTRNFFLFLAMHGKEHV